MTAFADVNVNETYDHVGYNAPGTVKPVLLPRRMSFNSFPTPKKKAQHSSFGDCYTTDSKEQGAVVQPHKEQGIPKLVQKTAIINARAEVLVAGVMS
jgi:hypothetical protein